MYYYSYSVDMSFDKQVINKDIFRDPALKKKAIRDVKSNFEDKYELSFISSGTDNKAYYHRLLYFMLYYFLLTKLLRSVPLLSL